jgi:hypothetical protein
MRVVGTLLCFLLSLGAAAQESKNEIGFTMGAELIPDRTANGDAVRIGNSIIFGANYARRLTGERTRLYLEFPFTAAPSHAVRTGDANFTPNLATLYVVPSLRVKFASDRAVSPWVSGGFGYGLYEGNRFLADQNPNPHRRNSSGTAQFGVGADVKTGLKVLFPLSLRGEVRDFYTVANPQYGGAVDGDGQHNVVVSGGFVIHF